MFDPFLIQRLTHSPPEPQRTEVGRVAEEIVANGGLLPDELMLRIVSSKLDALRNKVRMSCGFP